MSFGLQSPHHIFFVLRHHLTAIMLYARRFCPVMCGFFLVATQHIHFHTQFFKFLHRLFSMRFQFFAFLQRQIVGFRKVYILIGNGQRSRFINHHCIDSFHAFKCRSIFYQHVHLCRLSDGNHQSGRCGQPHGARTSYHQNGNRRQNGLRKSRTAAEKPPCQESEQSDACDCGHEDTGHTVYGALYGSLATLCLLNHFDNLCKSCILANLPGLQLQLTLRNHRSCEHLCTFLL